MIHISNFDTEMKGKTFTDTSSNKTLSCIGYGDNQGNPYLVGLLATPNGAAMKTVLLKNVEFIATPTAT
jgi:hypothetical protein